MIPLFKPYIPKNLPELESILYSGNLSYGKWGKLFENKLSQYLDCKYVLTTNSYNLGMLVVIETLGLKPGDEIIASPMTCLASTQPFATQRLKIIWADIDPKTGTLDPDSVKNKITESTKAIFHNHYCGYVGYIEEINKIAKDKGVFVVDDAIEAFGSRYKGNLVGNLGSDITIFSLQTVRLLNSIEGGAICFNSNALFNKAFAIRDYGINRNGFRDEFGEISKDCDIKIPGFGATLNEIFSYIGYQQLDEIDEILNKHKLIANKWKEKLLISNYDFEEIGHADQNPNNWVYGIKVKNKLEAIKYFREKGYYASSIHFPNNNYSVFGEYKSLIGIDDFFNKFIALPCGWWI